MNEREFERLWLELRPRLEVIAAQHARSLKGVGADDLVQEISIRLWRACVKSEQKIDNLTSYVSRIAATAAVDVVRRSRQRHRETLDSERDEVVALDQLDMIAPGHENRAALDAIIEQLEGLADNRQVAVRLKLQGFTHAEIAELAGWTEDKARNLATRGLAQLRQRLKDKGWTQ